MSAIQYRHNRLFIEALSIETLAKRYGTPCYIYSKHSITENYHAFDALRHPHRICYAVKANSNLAILNVLARLGSGFDIVSKGELARVLKAGGSAQKTVFSGVGKTSAEIEYALKSGIFCLNVESQSELERIAKIATHLNMQAPISLRVNPDVDPKTHPYISTGLKDNKFGLEPTLALELYTLAHQNPNLRIQGLACHIGSQITELNPFIESIKKLKHIINQLQDKNIHLSHLDIGGGLGINYQAQNIPSPEEYIQAIYNEIKTLPLEIILEPGRAIVAQSGILVTKLEYIKNTPYKNFAIVDTGMNDLLRPALYGAWQNIIPSHIKDLPPHTYDIVGPLCETGDFIGKERILSIEEGDYLVIEDSGAYGFSMSSTYNSRARPPEIMVDGASHHLIRQREDWENLTELESILPL